MNRLICMLMTACLLLPAQSAAASADRRVRLPILMYHSVCAKHPNDYVLTPKKFEADMRYLHEKGYTPVTISEVVAFVSGKAELPDKPIAVTFDDGFYNNFSVVLPIMKRFGFRFTLNVVGEYLEKEAVRHDRNEWYSYLNYAELRAIYDSGLAEIGNHTYDCHHPRGASIGLRRKRGESDAAYCKRVKEDAERCRRLLDEKCGIPCHVFAYPFGFYNKLTQKVIEESGYTAMLTCDERVNFLSRGETAALKKLRRFNRPNRYGTAQFFEKVVKL